MSSPADPQLPFPPEPGTIGHTPDGATVALRAMTPEAAALLGPRLAAIDPWARANYSGANLTTFFAQSEPAVSRYRILAADDIAGVFIVRHNWLHGPYLHFVGLLPPFHGRGTGGMLLGWLEREAQRAGRRNLWLCVSSYNTEARRLYERHGYALTAELDDLVLDGFQELLLRKRLV